MKKLYILFLITLVSSCNIYGDKHPQSITPENYKEITSTTDDSGTTVKKESSKQTTHGDNGQKKTVIESKVTQDPKGLLNKTTVSKTKDVTEEQDGVTTKTSHESEKNNEIGQGDEW